MTKARIDEWDLIGGAGVALLITSAICHWGPPAGIVSGGAICVGYLVRELRLARGRG